MSIRPAPRINVTPAQIKNVVTTFYDKARQDPALGPIFERHVRDWPTHIEKIARFWRNAILHERVYDGNPMQAHINADAIETSAFRDWLELFDQVLNDQLAPEPAGQWSALAHCIGKSLSMGLSMSRQHQKLDAVPVFN